MCGNHILYHLILFQLACTIHAIHLMKAFPHCVFLPCVLQAHKTLPHCVSGGKNMNVRGKVRTTGGRPGLKAWFNKKQKWTKTRIFKLKKIFQAIWSALDDDQLCDNGERGLKVWGKLYKSHQNFVGNNDHGDFANTDSVHYKSRPHVEEEVISWNSEKVDGRLNKLHSTFSPKGWGDDGDGW